MTKIYLPKDGQRKCKVRGCERAVKPIDRNHDYCEQHLYKRESRKPLPKGRRRALVPIDNGLGMNASNAVFRVTMPAWPDGWEEDQHAE